eukprot:TRINITY_DN2273_c0_g1_i5.p1 TRINITY_DN2273_c0_g1~~TRINITY_DN2273_c0_g1_i5.p1  ORF type:complete len:586 (+),score=115.79 TRINITY_DN2273_c0_g1_i5:180-1937(+)
MCIRDRVSTQSTGTKRSTNMPPANVVFHKGESAVQDRFGVRASIEDFAARVVRTYFTPQHSAFFSQIPFVSLAARDSAGRVWCSLVTGQKRAGEPPQPASIAPDEHSLHILQPPAAGDRLHGELLPGRPVGVVGVMLHNRRRNRVNGVVSPGEDGEDGAVRIQVVQSFGNCPQYITVRSAVSQTDAPTQPLPVGCTEALSEAEGGLPRALAGVVEASDTFFIGSGYGGNGLDDPTEGMDASHRGGSPGFVQVSDGGTKISFEDRPGNNHYNTLGNLALDPRGGMAFVDWQTGSVLQVSGEIYVEFGSKTVLTMAVEAWSWLPRRMNVVFLPPSDPPTELRIAAISDESHEVRSLYLQPCGKAPLASFRGGQYLGVTVSTKSGDVSRTYSLSCDPSMAFYSHSRASFYRISVRRQGLASAALHQMVVGDVLMAAGAPMGEFVLHPDSRSGRGPTVLIAAGVGVTPVLSMAHELLATQNEERVVLIHAVRDEAHLVFKQELKKMQEDHFGRFHVVLVFSRGGSMEDGVIAGRLDAEMLKTILGNATVRVGDEGVHSYVCGPAGFMGAMSAALEGLGAPEGAIHLETF